MSSHGVRISVYVFVGLALIALVVAVAGPDAIIETTAERVSFAPVAADSIVDVGKDVKIAHTVSAAIDDASWDLMMQAIRAKDTQGLVELSLQGKVFMVNPGETVKVLDMGLTSLKIRVMEGAAKGRAGWIVREAVKP